MTSLPMASLPIASLPMTNSLVVRYFTRGKISGDLVENFENLISMFNSLYLN